jgi:predicted nucleic acid-binding protein
MQGTFLDTNIFLRHILNDDSVKSAACRDLFRSIERRELVAWTTPLVVAEIVFVLSNPKTYNVSRTQLCDTLLPLLGLVNLKLQHKRLYARVFELFVAYPIDYVDAYHAAFLEKMNQTELFSFDTDFDGVPTVTRREP